MKKTLFILCFLFSQLGFSQNPQPILLSPKLNYENFIDATNQSVLLIDSTNKKTIQELENQAFKPLNSFKFEGFNFGIFKYNYWLKISLENPSDEEIKLLFTAGLHKKTEVFIKKDGKFEKIGFSNQEFLPSERPFKFDEKYLKLSFKPKTKYDLFIKITTHPQLNFKIQPKFVSENWEYKDKVRAFFDEYFYLIFDFIYVGILFFVCLYVMILFSIERKKYYLYYSLYLFFLLIFSLWAIEHSPYMVILFSYFPSLKFSSNNNTYVLISNVFYYLFIHKFLELPQISPRFGKVLWFYIWYILLPLLVIDTFINFVLVDFELGGYLWIITQPIISFFAFYGTFQVFKLKGALAQYIKWGNLALMIGALIGFSEQLFFQKPDDLVIMRLAPSIAFNIGVIIEMLFFTTALGFKSFLVQREKNKLIKSVKESELRTLRSQINPHFVFNSLNSIKSYILTHKSTEAAEYLTDFSTLMRSILQHSKEQLITLTDELETTLLYVKLEKLRFEDNFELIYELDESIDTDEIMIPPMLLQPYIENAIKHGLMNKEGKRILEILIKKKENDIEITIEDNGIGRQKASELRKNTLKHQSMGMSINDERVNLLNLTNDLNIKIEVIDKAEGTKVLIVLPWD